MIDASLIRRLANTAPLLVAGGLVVGGGLVTVAWFDYRATHREFLQFVRSQATTVSQTVAAAARVTHAAGLEAEQELSQRLIATARLLGEIDRRGSLTAERLAQVVERDRLFRVTVFAADGTRELSTGVAGPGSGAGPGWAGGGGSEPGPSAGGRGAGRGVGRPPWAGRGDGARGSEDVGRGGEGTTRRTGRPADSPETTGQGLSMAAIVEQLLSGELDEAVSGLHTGRWPGQSRLMGGVRRSGGGAIVVHVDAGDLATLQEQTSFDALLRGIVADASEVAYVAVQSTSGLVGLRGAVPDIAFDDQAASIRERRTTADGRPVLAVTQPVALADGVEVVLHVGMWLDGLARAEQRTWSRLAVSLTGALVLGSLAIGLVWMRRAYGALSRRHALAEAALKRRDRLAAMGELASTVAHEVRNPLNAIAMSAQRLRREYFRDGANDADEHGHEARTLLDVIHGESRRINTTIEQFLAFARPPKLSTAPLALGGFVEQTVSAHRASTLERSITLDVDTASAGTAIIDHAQLAQVVDNLVRNALDATPTGGRILVKVESTSDHHTIVVSDTGEGIPSEILPKIFDLYFTTKTDGTGIGLAISQQIVAAHGGTIEVESTPGEGTTMRVVLPAFDGGSRG